MFTLSFKKKFNFDLRFYQVFSPVIFQTDINKNTNAADCQANKAENFAKDMNSSMKKQKSSDIEK